MIQQLSQRLGGLRVYRELSRLLQEEEEDAAFAGAVVQALNLILLTSGQLQELRALLQGSLRSAEAAETFSHLFASFSYSCAASLALALLAQVRRPVVLDGLGGLALFGRSPVCMPSLHTSALPLDPNPTPQAYGLACELLAVMAQEPLSMRPETTVELSQLVSLLEAPAFAPLRLQLLQPGQHPALLRAVHGLLMLLPQVRRSLAACCF